uniref:Uncharacterized protein n=1 Tax=Aegilops tauschii subsp. strangulata TaxID=200361 RepID=A0A453H3K4_AEGTS
MGQRDNWLCGAIGCKGSLLRCPRSRRCSEQVVRWLWFN